MRDTYSLYEAKARLSALIRLVREGRRVVITVHGKPVAELRPVEPSNANLADRLSELAERGVLVRSEPKAGAFAPMAKRPGALERFLHERE